MMKVFNDLSRKKELFRINKDSVKIYSCGPTIYNYAHIGNLRAFTIDDLLVRLLRYKGYKVTHVRNLTDVDDKIIKNLKENGKTLKDYTNFYADAFFEDLNKLRHLKSDYYPRATEYVDKMAEFVSDLVDKGYAYRGEDKSYYFSINKFKEYGKLSGCTLENLKQDACGRMKNDEYGKDCANDFALWKAYNEEDGNVFWETKLGKGRPGWHIECSVMANTILGPTIDLHTGGEDLVFPHHENEIAQSEAHNGAIFARYWMHVKHLMVDGSKMSKSLNNFYTLRDIESKGYFPLALKLLYFMSQYRNQMNFTFEALENAQKNLNDINQTISKLTNYYSKTTEDNSLEIKKTADNALKKFIKDLEDDLNSPNALANLFEFVRYVNGLIGQGKLTEKSAKKILSYFKKYEKLLGLFEFPDKVSKSCIDLAWKRYNYRLEKNFTESDNMRKALTEKGCKVDDLPNGFVISKI